VVVNLKIVRVRHRILTLRTDGTNTQTDDQTDTNKQHLIDKKPDLAIQKGKPSARQVPMKKKLNFGEIIITISISRHNQWTSIVRTTTATTAVSFQ